MGMTVLIACCMVAYGGMAVQFFGISVLDAALLFAGFIVSPAGRADFYHLDLQLLQRQPEKERRHQTAFIRGGCFWCWPMWRCWFIKGLFRGNRLCRRDGPLFAVGSHCRMDVRRHIQPDPGLDIMGIVYFALLAAATVFALLAFLKKRFRLL